MNKRVYESACKWIEEAFRVTSLHEKWWEKRYKLNASQWLKIEVTRITEDDVDAERYFGEPGTAIGCELYIIDKNENEIDGCTVHGDYKKDLRYLLDMFT